MEKEVKASGKKDMLEKERTMKLSIKEGSATSVMSGVGDSYITPFALAIGANNAQIGLLSSFPSLVSPLSQILGSKVMEKDSRKRVIVTSVALQAVMWLPILVLGLFFWKNLFTSYLPLVLVIFYSLYAIAGAIAGPAWFSLMGDLVPEKIRGKYFSRRNKICGAVALVSMVIAAFILDFFKTRGFLLLGFSILFLAACIFRLISASLLRKHYYPKLELEKGYYFSIWQFIKKSRKNNFGRFVLYVALMNFTVNIAGPFFSVYMLRDLQFSYTSFMLANVSSSIFTLLFLPLVGRFSDRYGNRELLKLGSLIIPLIPFAWMLSANPVYIIIIPQMISGLGWAAFNFAASNFIYDSVSQQRRGLCVAYFNVIVGTGVFLGAILGGLLAQYLTVSFMNKLFFLFLMSGVLRFSVVFLLPKIREVRKVKKLKSTLFYFREINPIRAVQELTQEFVRVTFRRNKLPRPNLRNLKKISDGIQKSEDF